MRDCDILRPQLSRLAEGEAAPGEAMQVARHMQDCTACRIHLARERRLAAILEEELDDPVHVGEDFVRSVMDTLPAGPPPATRIRSRHTLKLAGIAGLLAMTPAFALRTLRFALHEAPLPGLGEPDLGTAERLVSVFAGVARTIPIALDALAGALPTLHVALGLAAGLAAIAAVAAAAAFSCAATVVAAATTGLIRRR